LSHEDPIDDGDRITLSWNDISVQSFNKAKRKLPPKNILTDVQGIVHPCSLMALMGASGAGKTTLLNVLNFRNRQGLKIGGQVMINGHVVDQKQMSDVSVFVQQQDIFVGTLTVKEHLMFHARLRMTHSTKAEIQQRVEDVMEQMLLKKCENVLIGIPEKIKGVSGGEAKRLAFAAEVLSKPTLIFCDEPTSGLDSFMARNLVKLLKRYASVGRTILCTIHQPSSEIFELFDHICIMAEGKCAFIGHASDCAATFVKAGFECPARYNPSDHYVFTLAVIPGREDECREKVKKITDTYYASPEYKELKEEIGSLMAQPKSDSFKRNVQKLSCGRAFSHLFTEFIMIMYRHLKMTIRDPSAFFIRLAIGIVMSLIVGLTWYRVDLKKESSQQNIPGCLFYLSTFVAMSATMSLLMVIPNELPVLTRDYLSGVYKIPMYYLGTAFIFTIEVFFHTVICVSIVFWMVFSKTLVDEDKAFPQLLATQLLVALVAIGVGMFISAASNSYSEALSLSNAFQTVLMLYAGFLILDTEIPYALRVFQYISSWYYSLDIQMHLIYENVTKPCSVPAFKQKTVDDLGSLMMDHPFDKEKVMDKVKDLCTPKTKCNNYLSGSDSLKSFDMEENSNTMYMIAMLILSLCYHVIGILVLWLKMWFKRR